MKDAIKNLLKNNSPSHFFEQVRERLANKAIDSMQSVAGTVAPTVFESQEQLDEVSQNLAKKYLDNASLDRGKRKVNQVADDLKGLSFDEKNQKRIKNRENGIKSATFYKNNYGGYKSVKENLELEEKQDPKMLGRYRLVNKDGQVVHSHDDKQAVIAHGKKLGGHSGGYRMVDTEKMNEDVEQLDEVSRELLNRYRARAYDDKVKSGVKSDKAIQNMFSRKYKNDRGIKARGSDEQDMNTSFEASKHARKRGAGIKLATSKIDAKKRASYNEEVEQLDEMRNAGTYHVLGPDGKRVYSGSYSKAKAEYEKRGSGHSLSKDAFDAPAKKTKEHVNIMNDYAKKIGAKPVSEDMGVNRIHTHNKKTGRNVETLVVNKKRRTKQDVDAKWKNLISKYKKSDD